MLYARWGLRSAAAPASHSFKARKKYLQRPYSVLYEPHVETVRVACGSSGHVTLNIRNKSSTGHIIIHVPSTFTLPGHPLPPNPPPLALLSSGATVVTITPRWSPVHRFPVPLHDVLSGYDWIVQHIYAASNHPSLAQPLRPSSQERKIAIYGENLSGGLATSVALTECRPSMRGSLRSLLPKPHIAALAVKDAIYDWSSIATSIPPALLSLDGENDQRLSFQGLYEARQNLLKSPSDAFDPFLSPVLFFRTSGMNVPSSFPGEIPGTPTTKTLTSFTDTESLDEMLWHDEPGTGIGTRIVSEVRSPEKKTEEVALFPPSRRSNLVFPPSGSGMSIPFARVAISSTSSLSSAIQAKSKVKTKTKSMPKNLKQYGTDELEYESMAELLQEQAEEITRLMMRSVEKHELKSGLGDGDADGRVHCGLIKGDDEGVWAQEWFDEVL